MIVMALLYANFMVPLLRAGLADAPMVDVRDSTHLYGDFVAVTDAIRVPGFEWVGYLLVLATISLGPVVNAVGLVLSGWAAVAEFRIRRLLPAVISTLSCLGFMTVLAVSMSPWGRTAKAWFFD